MDLDSSLKRKSKLISKEPSSKQLYSKSQRLEDKTSSTEENSGLDKSYSKNKKPSPNSSNIFGNKNFFSMVTHNLRNPFGTLLGFTEMMTLEFEDLTDEEKKYFITEISNSAKFIYDSFENLIHWIYLNSQFSDLDKESFDLYDIILDEVQKIKKKTAEKRINIHIQKEDNLPVCAGRILIIMLVRNLLSNAVKFNDSNGEINITFEENDAKIITNISDTGRGIDGENIDNLFSVEGVEQSSKNITEKGIGLGLLLCKRIVEVHNGQIWYDSALGKGSTFSFSLPKVKICSTED